MFNSLCLVIMVTCVIVGVMVVITTVSQFTPKNRYMLIEQKNVIYFDTWEEAVAYVKNSTDLDCSYKYQIFIKEKNRFIYITDSLY